MESADSFYFWSCSAFQRLALVEDIVQQLGLVPVSYTHLDVYKRQFIKGYDVIHSVIWGNVNQYMKTFKEWGKTIVYDFATDLDDPEIQKLLPYVDYGFFSYKPVSYTHLDVYKRQALPRYPMPFPTKI